jgi:hypothetical protein
MDVTKDLLEAAARFIEGNGGKVAVIGGIGVMQRPPVMFNYRLTIDFTGRPPSKREDDELTTPQD